jgi:predicted HNH restriction endonuclease
MPISKQTTAQLFMINDVVKSGGGRREFFISGILDDCVRIQPTQAQTQSQLRYDKLSIVIDSFAEIDDSQIEKSVGALLATHGLTETKNESYLYGFAREYLDRMAKGSLGNYVQRLSREIQESADLTQRQREQRLETAPRIAEKVVVTTTIFKRNADVIAERLFRADGNCGGCKERAPFNRRADGTPYLEVHHIEPLAEGGEDVIENTVALCPNCHRKVHYG